MNDMTKIKFLEAIPTWALVSVSVVLLVVVAIAIFKIRKKLKPTWDEIAEHQAELDSYLATNLSGVEIGTFYERYIGYLFENEGFHVHYHGAINGYDDLGRDLILKRDDEIVIIQTKCWAKNKQIQEKHIYQLYGTLEHYRRVENEPNAKAMFFTSAGYCAKAKEAARVLGIELRVEKLDRNYPMIKCNVSTRTKDKVYHFPFDDYYDTIVIEPHKGEFYARTVKDAVSRGFRRARKYRKTG